MKVVAAKFGVDANAVDQFDGTLDVEEFMPSLRDPLTPKTMDLVNKIFDILEDPKTGTTARE